jgi:transposase
MTNTFTSQDWNEGRRLRAWELHQLGWSQTRIAEALGVTQGAVSRWIARATSNGVEALRTRHPPGAIPKLSDDQRATLLNLLKEGAEAHGFVGEVWTQARIAQLIKRTFGVTYHRDHIGRILRELGWSVQKPQAQASERNDEAIAQWPEETWPEIKKSRARTTNAGIRGRVGLLSLASHRSNLRPQRRNAHFACTL